MVSHIGAAVALGFIIASAFMNYLFGHGLGRSPIEAHLYGAVGFLAVITNALSPFFVHATYRAQRLPTMFAIIALWLLCVAYSLTSALGFAAENRQALSAPKVELHDVLHTKLQTLNDLEARKRSFKIEPRIHALREEINALRAQGAMRDPDPQTAMLATFFGVERQSARTLLLILFAVMVETGAAIGLFAALSTNVGKCPTLLRAPKPTGKAKVWNPSFRAPGAQRQS